MRKSYKTVEKILLDYIYIQMNLKDVLSKAAVETTRVPNFKVILRYYATRFANSTRPFYDPQGPTCQKNNISKLCIPSELNLLSSRLLRARASTLSICCKILYFVLTSLQTLKSHNKKNNRNILYFCHENY